MCIRLPSNGISQAESRQVLHLRCAIGIQGDVEWNRTIVEGQQSGRGVRVLWPMNGTITIRIERRGESDEVVAHVTAVVYVCQFGAVGLKRRYISITPDIGRFVDTYRADAIDLRVDPTH